MARRSCSIKGCRKPHVARGFCAMHYQRNRTGRDMLVAPRRSPRRGRTCRIRGCSQAAHAKDLCKLHYSRDKTRAKPRTYAAIGETRVYDEGYIMEKTADGWAHQHRLIMERELGRKLFPDETVHHVNGDRSDNRPDNLELWTRSQPAGQRVADKVRWAREILNRYGSADLID